MVDDHLINNTQGTNGANKKAAGAGGANEEGNESREHCGTYWDKKTDAPESDDAAKTNPIKRENALIS